MKTLHDSCKSQGFTSASDLQERKNASFIQKITIFLVLMLVIGLIYYFIKNNSTECSDCVIIEEVELPEEYSITFYEICNGLETSDMFENELGMWVIILKSKDILQGELNIDGNLQVIHSGKSVILIVKRELVDTIEITLEYKDGCRNSLIYPRAIPG